jgi:carbon starvation protein
LAAGTLPEAQAAVAPQLIFNQRLDAALTVILCAILWIVILDTARVCWRVANGLPVLPNSEAPAQLVAATES